MSLTSAGPDGGAKRALGAARQLALGRLSVDQKATLRSKIVCRSRAVRALFLSDDEQQLDALFAAADEPVRRDQHRRRNSFRVRSPATKQLRPLESGWDIWGNRVEMRGESHTPSGARCPDVGASPAHLLKGHVPAAAHEPPRNEIHGGPLGARCRLNRQQLRRKRDDISHAEKLAPLADGVRTRRTSLEITSTSFKRRSGRGFELGGSRASGEPIDVLHVFHEHVLNQSIRFFYVS